MTDPRLQKDWMITPALDLELKQYVLLAYLQHVRARFDELKLYPHLNELREHLDGLAELRRKKEEMDAGLSRELIGPDLRNGRLQYAPMDDATWPVVVEEIIAFAAPELRAVLTNGRELYDEVISRMHLEPVGVLPLHPREGYLLLRQGEVARVYAYAVSLVHGAQDSTELPRMRTHYVTSYTLGLTVSYERIKAGLVRMAPGLPVPATFVLECDWTVPRIETYLPIAKQLVLAHITRALRA